MSINKLHFHLFIYVVWFEPTNVGKVPKLFEAFGPKAIHKLTALSPNLIELDALAKHLEDSDCLKFVKELKG